MQLQRSPRLLQLEKAHAAAKTQHSHKKRHFHWGKKDIRWKGTHEHENTDPYSTQLTRSFQSRALPTTLHFVRGSLSVLASLSTMLGCRYHDAGVLEVPTPVSMSLKTLLLKDHSTPHHLMAIIVQAKGQGLGQEAKFLPSKMCFSLHPLSFLFWDGCVYDSRLTDSLRL